MDYLIGFSVGVFIGVTADYWFSLSVRFIKYVKQFSKPIVRKLPTQESESEVVQSMQETTQEGTKRGRGRPRKATQL
jgi:hypothetical protein